MGPSRDDSNDTLILKTDFETQYYKICWDSPFKSDLTYSTTAVIDDNTKPGLGYLFAALAVLTAAAILFVSDLWLKCISRRERVNPNIKSHNRGCPHRRFVDENEKAQGTQYCR